MRVSTNTLFEIGAARIGSLQASLNRTSEQIASGRRILSPSDDPVAASQVLELTQTRELNTQFGVNRQGARHSLSMEEQALKSLTSLIQDVQTLLVSAGNGAYDDQQRKFMATELRGRLEDLMGIANTRDGAGNFLFAGYQTTTQPFARSDGSVQYAGDQGVRRLQVGPLRHIAVNDAGGAVFQNVKNGNGLFNVAVPAANTGSGVVSMGNSASGSPLTARYEVVFVSETEYTIVGPDTDPDDPPVLHTFVPGEMITAGSAQFSITGTPAAGDTFVAEPVRSESIFNTLDNLIAALERPATDANGKAALENSLRAANRELGSALDNVLTVRASVGARLNELDALDDQAADRDIQLAKTLTELQELDYTKAITDLTKQKMILEAAQQSFITTSRLSLFNFI